MIRSSGQSTALKTSHLCQWLESVASYYTTITSQALLCGRGEESERMGGMGEGWRRKVGEGGKEGWGDGGMRRGDEGGKGE